MRNMLAKKKNDLPEEFLGQVYYKCQMCGGYCYLGEPFRISKKAAGDLLIQVIKNQQFMGTVLYQAPMQVKHDCPDGSVGMAYFAGVRKVGEVNE